MVSSKGLFPRIKIINNKPNRVGFVFSGPLGPYFELF